MWWVRLLLLGESEIKLGHLFILSTIVCSGIIYENHFSAKAAARWIICFSCCRNITCVQDSQNVTDGDHVGRWLAHDLDVDDISAGSRRVELGD